MVFNVKKKTLLVLFLFVLVSSAHAAINVANGSFETGDFTNWTVAKDVNASSPIDNFFVSADGNTFTGTKDTYDLNSFDGGFAVASIEFGGCAGAVKKTFRFGSDNGTETEAQEHVIITQGQAEVPTYVRTYPSQICGTSPTAGNLVVSLVSRETSPFNATNITHTTQQVGIGDIICVNTQAGQNTTGGGTCEQMVTFDLVQLTGHTLTVIEPVEPIPSLNSFEVRATVQDVNGDFIQNADVNITLNGDTNAMVFSSGAYRITFSAGLPSGSFPFDVNSSFEGVDKGFSGTLIFAADFRDALIVTNINNTTIGVDFNAVNVSHSSFNKETLTSFAYDVENISNENINVVYTARGGKGFDFDIDPLKNFIIFTRDDNSTNFQLNDSLTFSIDRLWDNDLDEYLHFFEDPLNIGNSRQYKLDFKTPFIEFKSFEDQTLFTVGGSSLKKVQKDDRTVDQFSINKFSKLIINQTPDFGIITSTNTPNTAYVVSFTASVSEGTLDLTADGDTETITTTKRTVYFDVQGDFNIASEVPSTFVQLEVENIVMMERGFFTKELEIFDEFGNHLPIVIDDLNKSKQVLEEGQRFRVHTRLYERGLFEGQDLNLFIVEAFAFGVTDENKLISKTVEILPQDFTLEAFIDIDELIEGLITTEPTLPLLTPIKIQVQACGTRVDSDATSEPVCFATQETQDIVLRQFPFSSDQILITLDVDEFFVGENPQGSVFIETNFIETIQSVTISVFQQGGNPQNSDGNETFFKDVDFECFADFCTFGWRLDEFAFEEPVDYLVQATLKVTTSELDFDNPLLNEIEFIRAFNIEYKQTFLNLYNKSRDARVYLDHEKIPIILTLKDNLNLPTRDDLNVFFRVWDLGTADFNGNGDADPTFIQLNFNWEVYQYDINSGTNRYAFVGRFREKGGALQDGHFYRLATTINDHTKKRIELAPITLSTNTSTGGFDTDINAFAQENEITIKIDNSIVVENPIIDQNGLKALACLDPQTSGVSDILRFNQLARTIDSASQLNPLFPLGYILSGGLRFASSVVDDLFYKDCHLTWVDRGFYVDTIRVYVYNSYSDLTEQNPEFQQFMTFTIAEDIIVFNDGKAGIDKLIARSPSTCKTQFLGDTLGAFLCAVGTEGNAQMNEIVTTAPDLLDSIFNWFEGAEDVNQIATINSETRYLKFIINNIRPKNVLDFQEVAEIDFTGIPDTKVRRFLVQDNGLRISNEGMATVDIFQNGLKIKTIQLENNLYDRLIFNQFADQNGLTLTPFTYFIRADLCFNSGRNCLDPQILQFNESVSLKRPNKPFTVALGACFANLESLAECSLGFFSTPEVFVFLFVGFLLSVTLIFIVVLLKSPKARQTVFNLPGTITRGLRRRRR